ncbi:MAG TPA: HyaD/HybD family hydrogenase maturation endopeptidase [Ktedonobacterales bacterium]|nr:HyaD/HybD family hydrogenase maturation endopeptidase [Ktedonobacterales bacterium]
MANDMTLSGAGERTPVVVLGMGNLLRRDEGLGIRALQRLDALYALPPTVQLVDGGTLGLELLSYLEDAERALVLDAALSDASPGTLVQISGDDVPAYFSMRTSPHEIALPDLLAIAKLRGTTPLELVLVGMHPASIELGWDLSEIVASRLDDMVASAAAVLCQWGITLEPRNRTDEEAGHPGIGSGLPEMEARNA